MATNSIRQAVADHTKQLLASDSDPQTQLAAAFALHECLTDIVALSPLVVTQRDGADFVDTHTPSGVAIAPFEAAMCLREYLRTRQFALGVRQAIHQAQARFPGQRLRVLYAGTGPFATLATLQLPWIKAEDVGFTFLDIHATSTEATKHLFATLGAEDYVDAWVTADATTYEAEQTFHVVVTEVLQRALTREPQVGVTRQLVQFLEPDGCLVPEEITLNLIVNDPRSLFQVDDAKGTLTECSEERIELGEIFSLTQDTARKMTVEDGRISLGEITAPTIPHPDMTLNILTDIRTQGDLKLGERDCSLNLVTPADLAPALRSGERVAVRYRIDDDPGLEFERL